ncbi:MAG: hypothetical protein NT099_08010 [Candidatus Saganbacteria bacterium]|nr:hypothetical protein [Candidatus Saganbacteria bacterium]
MELRFEQSVYLSGKVIKIRPEKMELNDASFNACGLHSPHYNVTASQIILYPDIGWVVSYWGLFWYSGLPLMPIPTYLYDVKAEQRGRPNTPPFPEIGKNSDEGTFFHERLTWHVSENWNDRLTFSYMSNKGWGGGVDANYVANKSNEGYVRLFANPVDQWYGGITHFYSFGEDLNDKVGNPATIWPVFSEKHYALQLDLSYNEFNNYQRVGIVPGVTLYSNLTDVWNTPLKYKWSVGGARIREKASALELNRSKIDLGYLLDFPLWQNAVLTPGVELNSSYYEGNRQWIRQMGTLSLHQSFPGWGDPDFTDLKLKAQHYFKVEGNSPFLFEQYKYQPLAEFFAELSTNVGSSRVGIRTDHFLPSWNPNDIDYFVSAKWHCYDIIFTYRSLRGETTVSFGLEPPK